jgi:hypothetical protein
MRQSIQNIIGGEGGGVGDIDKSCMNSMATMDHFPMDD